MAPPRIIVFAGPTLRAREVRTALAHVSAEVVVLPPVQQGDILREMGDPPAAICILDGYFFQVPAVLHKEILFAIDRGMRVLGAASMGALRAAELDELGMEGVGVIYGLFRDGTLDADDEVAVLHGGLEDEFRPQSDALVNIRLNLEAAVRSGLVSAVAARRIVDAARAEHFTRRSFKALLRANAVGLAAHELSALSSFLSTELVDWKRRDALDLLALVAARTSGATEWPALRPPQVAETVYTHLHRRAYTGREVHGTYVPDATATAVHQLVAREAIDMFSRVTMRWATLHDVEPDDVTGPPLIKPGIPWEAGLICELKSTGAFPSAQHLSAAMSRFSDSLWDALPGVEAALSESRLEGWVASLWRVERHELQRAALERGFASRGQLIATARMAYSYVRWADRELDPAEARDLIGALRETAVRAP